MKLNKYQKIVLLLYGVAFIYFSVLHVPFKINHAKEIAYDTLFSKQANLDVSRLVLILLIITVFSIVLFLLAANLRLSIKPIKVIKRFSYISLGIIFISLSLFIFLKYCRPKRSLVKAKMEQSDSTTILSPGQYDEYGILIKPKAGSTTIPDFVKKNYKELCNEKMALEKFRAHMKFYYPDWKIYGKPMIKNTSDCIYEIQFKTADPHLHYSSDKEVIIVRMNLKFENFETGTIYFNVIRGELY
jgi:hypothetical protein